MSESTTTKAAAASSYDERVREIAAYEQAASDLRIVAAMLETWATHPVAGSMEDRARAVERKIALAMGALRGEVEAQVLL